MTRDTRTYVRIHDGMPDHPKVVGLSDAAFRSYVELICWCSRHLTDGKVPTAAAKRLGSSKSLREMTTAGLLEIDETGWIVRDYLQHQRSADEVALLREKRRDSGSRGGIAKAKAVANARPVAKQNPGSVANIDRDIEQTKTKAPSSAGADALTEVPQPDTLSASATEKLSVGTRATAFQTFWAKYPRKVGKQDAERVFDRQRKLHSADAIIAGVERLASDPNLPEQQYIPHASTWLARGGWEDEPYPPPEGQAPAPSGWQLPDPPAGMEVGGAEWQAWRLEQQARRTA